MSQLRGPLRGPWPCLLMLAALATSSSAALATSTKHAAPAKKTESASRPDRKVATPTGAKKTDTKKTKRIAEKHHKKAPADDKPAEKAEPQLTSDLAVLKDVIHLQRQGKTSDATDSEKKLVDPAAQKLAEWFILRHPDSEANFSRYVAFIASNPDWPGVTLLRRRAEARLW